MLALGVKQDLTLIGDYLVGWSLAINVPSDLLVNDRVAYLDVRNELVDFLRRLALVLS